MVLTDKQRTELHQAMLDYMTVRYPNVMSARVQPYPAL